MQNAKYSRARLTSRENATVVPSSHIPSPGKIGVCFCCDNRLGDDPAELFTLIDQSRNAGWLEQRSLNNEPQPSSGLAQFL